MIVSRRSYDAIRLCETPMRIYNVVGYTLLILHALVSAFLAPSHLGLGGGLLEDALPVPVSVSLSAQSRARPDPRELAHAPGGEPGVRGRGPVQQLRLRLGARVGLGVRARAMVQRTARRSVDEHGAELLD